MKYLVTLLFALALGFLTIGISQDTHAADKNDFNAGNIIDDAVFYNANSMNAAQIQTFLESKNPNCDYNGTQSAADWGYPNLTHAQIAEYKRNGTNGFARDSTFHAPPYKCLTMYSQATPQMEASSGYCSAIGAGTRSAAQIINDVAKACGINPQVLIILLEKEQSLVTDKWPLDRQLKNATGFACPDTAPCDPAYAGFFYQVYHAARQFKVYQAFPNSYNYRAGRNNNIYWNPDLSRCGSSSVYIQNQATAALYIYTPYRPNDAALNNLYGTGDSCSAYGNRNFWRIFTDWFGSTRGFNVLPEISSRYSALGGINGSLGVATDYGYCNGDRSICWQSFRNGTVVYSSTTGAWESTGAVRTRWAETGYQTGFLGFPTGPEQSFQGGGFQQYQNGRIYWKNGASAWSLNGAIGERYIALNATQSYLGFPAGNEVALPSGGVYQQFERGRIYWKEGLGTWTTFGGIGDRYTEEGATASPLGYPIGAEVSLPNQGIYQQFENGRIYWKESTGAWAVYGSAKDKYLELSAQAGFLGYPIGKQTSLTTGGTYQQFENGRIYSKVSTGSWTIHGTTGNRYLSVNSDRSYLGYPTSGEISIGGGGVYQQFEKGRIYWKESTGAWTIFGGTGDKFIEIGAQQGYLGYPTSGEIAAANGGVYQQFENGRIYWKEGVSSWTIHGATGARFLTSGAERGYLGYPTGPETTLSTGGVFQQFENGRIYYSEATGAWSVHGAIREKFLSMNATLSYLGYPTNQESTDSNGAVYQQFEHGRIYWKSGVGSWTTTQ